MKKKNKGLFVSGTGTHVGKTLISGAIVRALLDQGMDCGVMKPIESGCDESEEGFKTSDAYYLQKAAKSQDPLKLICPCRFRAPLSPYAAVLQGEKGLVSWPLIEKAFRQLCERHGMMLIEGAGGLMVPITSDKDMSDLISLVNLPVLLVAQSGLGTLNHTLLSLEYGKARGISFLGIVLNQRTPKRDFSEVSNAKILRERSGLPVLSFPYIKNIKTGKDMETTIAESAEQMAAHPLMEVILQALGIFKSD